jgi:hypothetical protein
LRHVHAGALCYVDLHWFVQCIHSRDPNRTVRRQSAG